MSSPLRSYLVGLLSLCLAPLLPAIELLNLQESPALSGLFSVHEESNYASTGVANGSAWLINAEGGDRVTFHVRTTTTANSYPRIRISNSGGTSLTDIVGTVDGSATLERFAFATPGVYQVTVYSNNSASAFSLDAILGRGVELEEEDNNLRGLAGSLITKAQAGGFTAAIAGILDQDVDWHDLGVLAAGNTASFSVETPASSTLQASSVELALFKDDEASPRAVSTGTTLSHNVVAPGRYRVRVRVPDLQGQYLRFTGGSDQVSLGNPPALRITGSQTIEFWIKPDDFNTRQNPYGKAYGGEGTMTLETDGTINYFYGTNGGNNNPYQSFNSNARLRIGRWQHLALVRDFESTPKQLRWYLDGQLVSQATAQYIPAVAGTLPADGNERGS